MIEVAEVIGIGLHSLEDPMGLHIVQGQANWIVVLMIFKGFSVVKMHLGVFFLCCGALLTFLLCQAPEAGHLGTTVSIVPIQKLSPHQG